MGAHGKFFPSGSDWTISRPCLLITSPVVASRKISMGIPWTYRLFKAISLIWCQDLVHPSLWVPKWGWWRLSSYISNSYFKFRREFLLLFPESKWQRQPGHFVVIFLEAFFVAVRADKNQLKLGPISRCFHIVVKLDELMEIGLVKSVQTWNFFWNSESKFIYTFMIDKPTETPLGRCCWPLCRYLWGKSTTRRTPMSRKVKSNNCSIRYYARGRNISRLGSERCSQHRFHI